MRDQARGWGAKHQCVVHTVQPVIDRTTTNRKAAMTQGNRTDKELFLLYGKQYKVPEAILKTGLEFLD
jgi:hypothetical protein